MLSVHDPMVASINFIAAEAKDLPHEGASALVHATCNSHETDTGMLLLFIATCKLQHVQQDAWLTVQSALQLAVTQMLPSFVAAHPEVSLFLGNYSFFRYRSWPSV